MSYGTVKYWLLVTENVGGAIKQETFHSWDEATEAFRETERPEILAAAVYAVQTNGRQIETWTRKRDVS